MRARTRFAVLATATVIFSFTGGTAGFTDGEDHPDQGATVSESESDATPRDSR